MNDLETRELLKLRSACRVDKESLECCELFLNRQRSGWQDEYVPDDRDEVQKMTLDEAYELLGVSPDADDEGVKRAYRARMRETHPDLNNAGVAESVEVNVAMEVIRRHRSGL
jgi:DnaJ-domain-containing protein 1